MIQLNDVHKVYEADHGKVHAVKNVNLQINKGEIYGIIGYSGAGKSTLIRLLNGLEQPSQGTVIVNNYDLSKAKPKTLREARKKISMIFQHFNLLWSRTVEDNIEFPLEIAGIPAAQRKERVKELVSLVGLEGREKAYPSELSGGQKQRVGIARALANNPDVLLCDEATSALDPETTDSILDLLSSINEKFGLTIVLITHEMHVIQKICNRVAVMEAGEVVEEGAVLNVFKNPQAAITKKFVSQVGGITNETQASMDQVFTAYPTGKVVKLVFVGQTTEQPVISQIVKQVDVHVNIIQGSISHTQSGPFGTLYIQIDGSPENIQKALSIVEDLDIQAEVIEHA